MGKGGDANKQEQVLLQTVPHGEPVLEEFYFSNDAQWHPKRAREILKEHPEVNKLMGHGNSVGWKIAVAFVIQFVSLELLVDSPFWMQLTCCYFLSGTVTGVMTLALHELSHNLGAKKLNANRFLSMIGNITMGIPAAATFKRYHLEHHKFLGEDVIDVDIPSYFEGRHFQGAAKIVWLFFQPLWYAVRPMILNAKEISAYELFNIAWIIATDLAIYSRYGFFGVWYLAIGTLLGMQFHPVAGHFVAEHYIFNDGQETYSYYGPLNWLVFNVGYHIEHHDFSFISGSRLPELRRLANEFYDPHPCYHSWIKVMVDFVLDPYVTPFSRIKRQQLTETQLESLKARGGLVK